MVMLFQFKPSLVLPIPCAADLVIVVHSTLKMQPTATLLAVLHAILFFTASTPVLGCSRVTYKAGVDDRITIGRSMDFVANTNTSYYAFPAGLTRDGKVPSNPLNWTSKYGSVTNLMYNAIYTEGMNSEGLTGSTLYLDGSDYGMRNTSRPGLFIGLWLQYFLDMYANVTEAANDVCPGPGKEEKFQIITKQILPNVNSVGHVSISDKSGDNLVMEYINGKLNCYHSKDYVVMTNEPPYDQQLALETYWGNIANFSLPGTSRPAGKYIQCFPKIEIQSCLPERALSTDVSPLII